MAKPKLVIVDDLEEIRQELAEFLRSDFDIVGEASTGFEAVDVCVRLQPDFVLMDIVMPKMSGIEATKEILQGEHKPVIIILSGLQEDSIVMQAMESGAIDYLVKPVELEKLRDLLLEYANSTAA